MATVPKKFTDPNAGRWRMRLRGPQAKPKEKLEKHSYLSYGMPLTAEQLEALRRAQVRAAVAAASDKRKKTRPRGRRAYDENGYEVLSAGRNVLASRIAQLVEADRAESPDAVSEEQRVKYGQLIEALAPAVATMAQDMRSSIAGSNSVFIEIAYAAVERWTRTTLNSVMSIALPTISEAERRDTRACIRRVLRLITAQDGVYPGQLWLPQFSTVWYDTGEHIRAHADTVLRFLCRRCEAAIEVRRSGLFFEDESDAIRALRRAIQTEIRAVDAGELDELSIPALLDEDYRAPRRPRGRFANS